MWVPGKEVWGYLFKHFMYLCIYFRISVVGGHHIACKVFSVKISLSYIPSPTLLTYLLPQLNLFWFHYSNLIFKYCFIQSTYSLLNVIPHPHSLKVISQSLSLCEYSKWNTHIWRLKSNIHRWKNICDICFSGSEVHHSKWFLSSSIHLLIILFFLTAD